MPRRRMEVSSTTVQCPSCWEDIELTVDVSAGSQTYVEDCSVCCNPMVVRLRVDEESQEFTVDVEAENAD